MPDNMIVKVIRKWFWKKNDQSNPDSDSEISDCALCDALVNYDSDQDNNTIQEFVCKTVQNFSGWRENFMESWSPRCNKIYVWNYVHFEMFFNKELVQTSTEEINS